MKQTIFKKIYALILIFSLIVCSIPVGAISFKEIDEKSTIQDESLFLIEEDILDDVRTDRSLRRPMTDDDLAILHGFAPRGELYSERSKNATALDGEIGSGLTIEFKNPQVIVKETILEYKSAILAELFAQKKHKDDFIETVGVVADKYQITIDEISQIDEYVENNSILRSDISSSDVLVMIDIASGSLDFPVLTKADALLILQYPDKLDLLIEHALLSEIYGTDYSKDIIYAFEDEHDLYDAQYYSERLDSIIETYIGNDEASLVSMQNDTELQAQAMQFQAIIQDAYASEAFTTMDVQRDSVAKDYTEGYNKYIGNAGAYAFDSGERAAVNPATGALEYSSTDIYLPGKNGLDLEIKTNFNSNLAVLFDSQVLNKVQLSNDFATTYLYNDFTEISIRNELGTGWSFGFPFVETNGARGAERFPTYINMGDGTIYQIEYTVEGYEIADYHKDDLCFDAERSDENEWEYALYFSDGRKMMFDNDGCIVTITDKFFNTIYFYYSDEYPSVGGGYSRSRKLPQKIVDTMGREIFFTYSGDFDAETREVIVSYVDDEGENVSVEYSLERYYTGTQSDGSFGNFTINMPDEIWDLCIENNAGYTHYKLVTKTDASGRETNFSYSEDFGGVLFHDYSKYPLIYRDSATHNRHTSPSGTRSGKNLQLVMNQIEYPTGFKTEFQYTSLFANLSKYGASYAQCGQVEKTIDKDANDVVLNETTYKYSDDYSGFSSYPDLAHPELDRMDLDLPENYPFSVQIIGSDDIGTGIYFREDKLISEQKLLPKTTSRSSRPYYSDTTYSEYDDHNLPKQISYYLQDPYTVMYGIIEENEYFEYDSKGNVTASYSIKATGNGDLEHKTSYTYDDNCNMLTSKTYKTDADTTIREEYDLTDDGTSVAYAEIYENDVLKKKTGYTYDSSGNVTEIRSYTDPVSSPNSYILTQYAYDYDADNDGLDDGSYTVEQRVTGVQNIDGEYVTTAGEETVGVVSTVTQYDYAGRPARITDANGNVTEYTYDNIGRVIEVDLPDGNSVTCTYNDSELTAIFTDENSTSLKYTYDDFGRLSSIIDVQTNSVLLSYTYDTMGRISSEQNNTSASGSHTTSYTYDPTTGNLWETIVTDEDGNTVFRQETLNDLWYFGDEAYIIEAVLTRPTKLNTAIADVTYKTIDGEVAAVSRNEIEEHQSTDYFDQTILTATTYEYDYIGRPISEKNARFNDDSSSYTQDYTKKYEYDYAGNVTKVYDAFGNYATFTYDFLGRKTSEADFNAVGAGRAYSVSYTYDNLGRIIKTETPYSATETSISKLYYDPAGNLTSSRITNNAEGESTSYRRTDYGYNERNMLTDVVQYDDGTPENYTAYYYDGVGNILRMYTGLSSPITVDGLDDVTTNDDEYSVTKYAYDRFGNIVSVIKPEGQSESYTYDLNQNLTSYTDANGNVTEYTYDALSRVIEEITTAPDDTELTQLTSYTFTGKIASVENDDLEISYTYDMFDRLSGVNQSNGITKTYTYDVNDNRTSLEVKANGLVCIDTSYTYDAMDRLMLVYEDGSFAAEYIYDSNGNRIMLSYANDNITTYLYNYANLVTSLTNENDQGIISDYTYDYYLDGNQRRKIEDSGKVTVYTYDDLGRLTSEAVTDDGETNTLSYTYDDSSNRATMTSAGADAYTVSYDYDLNNRLLTQSKIQGTNEELIEYYYDPNGNQTAKNTSVYSDSTAEESFELTAGEIEQYEYNAIDQLIASSVDGVSATYTYQPDGLRLTKTAGANTTQFVWDGMNLALELDETDAYTSKYIRGTNALYREDANGTKQHYLYNAHGDVVQLTDNDGDVTKTYVYDAFGNELNPDPTDTNPLRYAGEYYDAETGTYYLRARYYDAAIGRFIGEDTWTGNANDPLSLNRYTYCYNNPVRYYDSSGNIPVETIIDVASLGWSAVELWNNPSWENLGFFAWDVAATLIPYVPGSYVVRAGTLIAKADDVYKTLKRLDVAERVDLISDGKVMLPYKKMKRLTKGTDLEAHHLIEKRFADVLGIKEGDIISVALDKNSHQKITNRMRDKIPYEMKGADQGRFSTTKANKEDVWRATKETYTELGLEKYIEPVKDMFRSVGFTDFD